MLVHARLERLEENITLADEVVKGGEQSIKGTLCVEARSGGQVKDAVDTPLYRHKWFGWRPCRGA